MTTFSIVGPEASKILSSVHQECFPTYWNIKEFENLLQVAGTVAVLAESHQPCAMMVWRNLGDQSEIITLAVRPAFRRQKLAQSLLKQAMESAQQSGARRMFLEVSADNAPAAALYAQAGFAPISRRKAYFRQPNGSFTDALVMARDFA